MNYRFVVLASHWFNTNRAFSIWTVGGKTSIYQLNLATGTAIILPYPITVKNIKSFTLTFNF